MYCNAKNLICRSYLDEFPVYLSSKDQRQLYVTYVLRIIGLNVVYFRKQNKSVASSYCVRVALFAQKPSSKLYIYNPLLQELMKTYTVDIGGHTSRKIKYFIQNKSSFNCMQTRYF